MSGSSRGADEEIAGESRLPVVVLTTFFPNPRQPHRTVFVRNLVDALRRNCDVTVVAPVPRRPPLRRWRDVEPVPLQEVFEGTLLRHPRFLSIPGLQWMTGLLYWWGVWREVRALKATIPNFVLHTHFAYPDGVGAALVARQLRVPLVITVHGSDINEIARSRMLKPQIRWALLRASCVIAVSQALAEKVTQITGLGSERINCIPCSGFAAEVFKPRDKSVLRHSLQLSLDASIVVFVGQLVTVKAVDVLLRAWAEVAQAGGARPPLLFLIGAGPEQGRLERQMHEAGLAGKVVFLGALPQRTVADWVAAADVLCLPSHSEGTPNVVVEALASGVPVVASHVGGIPALVKDGVNGYTVPPAQPAQLATALMSAMAGTWDPDSIAASVAHLTWPQLAARNREVLQRAFSEMSDVCPP